ncbi:phosphoglycerate mutase family protein [Fructilactobacillus cliffordii]|uniref:histidine phosphatase family protein n=1 Tax=Fructilactobacillus cliffordii TaxID=2940299 RepID=UPI002092F956|nr:histidine phosphatase family protein [Fructilactobacillus cliffordii]USS86103.1 phosphoglycerate mutase family protein [Fructilactobacillus cliffordii]
MAKFTLYLVRHGQTYYNVFNKLQGWSNSPLTQQGIDDAVATGKRLKDIKFKAAYCSDLTRAQKTMSLLFDQNETFNSITPIVSPFFREEFYGYFEGLNMDEVWYQAGAPHGAKTFAEIIDQYDMNVAKDFLKQADPFHMAENAEEYWHRLQQGLDLITSNPNIEDGDSVLLVSHGNTLLSLVDRFSQPGQFDLRTRPANGSITKLAVDGDQLTVTDYNK